MSAADLELADPAAAALNPDARLKASGDSAFVKTVADGAGDEESGQLLLGGRLHLGFDPSFSELVKLPHRAPAAAFEWTNVALERAGKRVLAGVSGQLFPGEAALWLGPPGAGKTTLVQVLAGHIVPEGSKGGKAQDLSGELRIAGQAVAAYEFRKFVGYVVKGEPLYPFSTARETLAFAAKLRAPVAISDAQRATLVGDLLGSLGLASDADTVVAKLTPLQRKFLALGVELATLPSAVFVDDPFTGLDPVSQLKYARVANAVAARTRAVVVVTAQAVPSETYAEFERVAFLAHGHVAFQGARSDVARVFAEAKLAIPAEANPAEFCTLVSRALPFEKLPCDDANKRAPRSAHTASVASASAATATSLLPTSSSRPTLDKGGSLRLKPADADASFAHVPRAGFWTQYWELQKRELHATFTRNKILFVGRTVVSIIVAVLIAVVFVGLGDVNSTTFFIGSAAGSVTLLLFTGAFGAMSPAVIALGPERVVYVRERSAHMYGPVAYHLAKLIPELFVNFWIACVGMLIVYWAVPLRGDFMWFVCALLLTYEVCFAAALLLVAATPNAAVATALVPLVLVPQLFWLGALNRTANMTPVLRWAKYLCFVQWGVSIGFTTELSEPCPAPYTAQCNSLLTGNDIHPEDRWWYALILVLFFVVFRVLAVLRLEARAKRAKRAGVY